MDEPQLSSQVAETAASTGEKSDLNEALESAFGNEDLEKPMDIDNVALDVEPATSSDVAFPESAEELHDNPAEAPSEEAGELKPQVEDDPMSEIPYDSMQGLPEDPSEDQLPDSTEDVPPLESTENEIANQTHELDETAQTDNLDFTEQSINISQLNVDHNDDSNDAFNALKQSETDALNTTTEELEEHKQEEEDSGPKESETADNESKEGEDVDSERKEGEEIDAEQKEGEEEVDSPADETITETDKPQSEGETIETPMETDEAPTEGGAEKDQETADAETNEGDQGSEGHDVGTGTAEFDDHDDGADVTVSYDKPAEDEAEEIPDDDGTTETTNETEGVDEDVCLLGDEIEECDAASETDKDTVTASEGGPEDEEMDTSIGEKEVSTEKPAATDEVVEIEDDAADKEVEEPQEVEEEHVPDHLPLKENEIREIFGEKSEQTCLNCENSAVCLYQVLEESGEIRHLCSFNCVKEHREDNPDKYSLTQRKVNIYEMREPEENPCSKCGETKTCKYRYKHTVVTTITKERPAPAEGEEAPEEPPEPLTETTTHVETKYLCDEPCLKEFTGDNTEKYIVREVQRRSTRTREAPKRFQEEEEQEVPKIVARTDAEVEAARFDREQSFIRRCAQCLHLTGRKFIQWETFDFCNEKCLGQYQNLIGATCAYCNQVVSLASIGKLCVRFGADIRQFCTSTCLNDFKKCHHPCLCCSKNLKKDGEEIVSAKRGSNYCDDKCAKQYDEIVNPRKKKAPYICSVCNNKKVPKVEVLLDGNTHRFCSNPCFSAFKFVNNVAPDQCELCTKYFERKSEEAFTIHEGNSSKIFCTQICMNIFITKHRQILKCNWCKVSKYNYDMIYISSNNHVCSLNCMSLQEVSVNAITKKRLKCDHCKTQKQPQYHLSMSDASIRNFCTYQCVLGFQSQFSKSRLAGETPSVVPAGTAKRIKPASANHIPIAPLAPPPAPSQSKQPVISLVQSLNSRGRGRPPLHSSPYNPITNRRSGSPIPVPELTVQLERLSDLPPRVKISSLASLKGPASWTPISTRATTPPVRVEHKTQVVTIPPLPKSVGNKSTMCKAITLNKAINCTPTTADAECQTEDWLEQRIVVPVPIPIYVPQPMMMYSAPTPIPVPFVLPVPVPVFVPTTRNSSAGIMKEIKKIQEKMPTDPYEAELLMMAEMVAGDKKREETDSDSDENNEIEYGDTMENNASFNEDLVQMAFKMAGNDFDDPPVDLENEMTANTISQTSSAYGDEMDPHSLQHHQLLLLQQQRDAVAMQSQRGRKRMPQPVKQTNNRNSAPNKRIKREMEVMQPEMPREPVEKPDANMCLKYTFGVNAWKQWVATKNADFEKSSIRRKPIKSEILQLTADELNYSLCMFVKEVRKPNGSEYAPDTIYYLVLGIQQYLYENGRIDNIFTDRYYEQFTDCLDEVAKKFSVLYNDSQYIVTRVEEEHLWECKQLGAHSPHVLLSTLMFFNTKHFNLVTVDEHMELSFSHIMKHWKRNPNQPGAAKVPGSRNVLLRFYPPQSSLEANSRKKKVYEQQENEENPLRCPVKLYEFYLSKCPESVKTRNDVFYLQPERSCVPDSPVWYSTQPLSRDALSKMLHRVKMVKEINIALLTS